MEYERSLEDNKNRITFKFFIRDKQPIGDNHWDDNFTNTKTRVILYLRHLLITLPNLLFINPGLLSVSHTESRSVVKVTVLFFVSGLESGNPNHGTDLVRKGERNSFTTDTTQDVYSKFIEEKKKFVLGNDYNKSIITGLYIKLEQKE